MGNANLSALKDKKAGLWSSNQPLPQLGTFSSLMSSCRSITAAPWGHTCPQKGKSPLSQRVRTLFFRSPSSEHPFPDVLCSGKKSEQSCAAPHGKAGNLLNTAPRRGLPHTILGFPVCRLVRKLLLLKFFQLHFQGPVPVNVTQFQRNS